MDQSIVLPELPRLREFLGADTATFQLIDYLTKQREAIISAHDETARAINDLLIRLTPRAGATYAPTNVSTDRAYDADTVVVAELADVVGTLIADLKSRGII